MSEERKKREGEIVERKEGPLTVTEIPFNAIESIHTAGEALTVWPPWNQKENIRKFQLALGQDETDEAVKAYIESIHIERPARRFPEEPPALVIPWEDEITDEGKRILDTHLDKRKNHPIYHPLVQLKSAAISADHALGETIDDTKRYLEYFFPRLPLDSSVDIDWDAIIPTTKEVLWGLYKDTGVPFHASGHAHQSVHEEKPIMTGPFLPSGNYNELATIVSNGASTFVENLHQAVQLIEELRAHVDLDPTTTETFDQKGRFASAVSIVNSTLPEVLNHPDESLSGIYGMYLWRALREIQKKFRFIVEHDKPKGYPGKGGLIPNIDGILKPPYKLFIEGAGRLGYSREYNWRKRLVALVKPIED